MNPRTPEVTEPMLHWLLGVALGLILGYVWGQHDAHNPPETPMTTKIHIQHMLADMVRNAWRADLPQRPLPLARACHNCQGSEDIDVSYRLLTHLWEISCGCGTTSSERKTLRAAINAWNRENRA